jgi:hypothetical protein
VYATASVHFRIYRVPTILENLEKSGNFISSQGTSGVPAVLKFLKFKLCPEFVLKFEVVLKFRKFWIFVLKFGVAQ